MTGTLVVRQTRPVPIPIPDSKPRGWSWVSFRSGICLFQFGFDNSRDGAGPGAGHPARGINGPEIIGGSTGGKDQSVGPARTVVTVIPSGGG
jgi:hypothetical protein